MWFRRPKNKTLLSIRESPLLWPLVIEPTSGWDPPLWQISPVASAQREPLACLCSSVLFSSLGDFCILSGSWQTDPGELVVICSLADTGPPSSQLLSHLIAVCMTSYLLSEASHGPCLTIRVTGLVSPGLWDGRPMDTAPMEFPSWLIPTTPRCIRMAWAAWGCWVLAPADTLTLRSNLAFMMLVETVHHIFHKEKCLTWPKMQAVLPTPSGYFQCIVFSTSP